MKILLDTNVPLRFATTSHGMHLEAKKAITKLHDKGEQIVLVPQVIFE